MTSEAETYHKPVLLQQSIDGLDIQPGGVYIDMTYGGGGHSAEILRRLGPKGHLYAFDQDADAEKNIVNDDRLTFVRSNFRYTSQWMRYFGVKQVNGAIADLGMSSHHLDDETRGFSFRFEDAPLDMRMNKRAGQTAADVLNNYDEERLANILRIYGELKEARKIAASIVKARAKKPIATTQDLLTTLGIDKDLQNSTFNVQWKKDLARLFQALRIEVNHEMDALREMLTGITKCLAKGGRLSVITYHSLEDRIVKNVMRSGNAEGKVVQDFYGRIESPFHLINNKVIVPSDEEIALNPRSRSAKLRIAEKQ